MRFIIHLLVVGFDCCERSHPTSRPRDCHSLCSGCRLHLQLASSSLAFAGAARHLRRGDPTSEGQSSKQTPAGISALN